MPSDTLLLWFIAVAEAQLPQRVTVYEIVTQGRLTDKARLGV